MKVYVSFCGIGLGHASRALKIGNELKERGHEVLFSTYEPTYSKLNNKKIVRTLPEVAQCQEGDHMGIFMTAIKSGLIMLTMPFLVLKQMSIIKEFNPDVIIADTSFSALIAGKIKKKPVLFITNQSDVASFFPGIHYIPVRMFINGFYWIFVEMADRFLVPDLPLPNAICKYNMKFFGRGDKFEFIGPVVKEMPENARAVKYKRKTIMVSLGGSGLKADISKYLLDTPQVNYVIINSPFDKKEGNIIYKKFVRDYFSYLKGCDALLTHGGHTSIIEAVVYGKPVLGISLKGYAERENNLKGIKNLGDGSVVEDMKIEIEKISKYKKVAKKLQKLALKHNGAKRAADLAEQIAVNR